MNKMFFKNKINTAPTKKAIAATKRRFANAILLSQKGLEEAVSLGITKDEGKVIETKDGLKFVNKMSKFSKRVTYSILFVIIALFVAMFIVQDGTYFSVWVFSLALATFFFAVLSFPRSLIVRDKELVINCILETTLIDLQDIKRIHTINSYRMKRTIPLIGSYGFGGFYGLYVDLIHLRSIKMFATNLSQLVYIQTIYNDHYIVSCENSSLLIDKAREAIVKLKPDKSNYKNWDKEEDDNEDDD